MANDKDKQDAGDGSGTRSGRYPGVSLEDAIEAAGKLYKAERLSPINNVTAVAKMGFKGLSGPAKVMIGALRQYGLIERTADSQFRLSRLANEAMHGNEDQKSAALRKAAVNPPLFLELSRSHLEASEDNVRSYLITNKGFIDTGARKAARTFRDTLKFAKVTLSDYTQETDGSESEISDPLGGFQPVEQTKPDQPTGRVPDGVFALNVPFAKGSIAVQVRVSGQPISKAALARVRQYLQLAEEDLESADE